MRGLCHHVDRSQVNGQFGPGASRTYFRPRTAPTRNAARPPRADLIPTMMPGVHHVRPLIGDNQASQAYRRVE